MKPENDPQLEQLVHRELRRLPERRAPANLIPRVRAALAARESRTWWQQPWLNWPRAWQAASLVCAFGLLGGVCFATLNQDVFLNSLRSAFTGWFGEAGTVNEILNALSTRVFATPYLAYVGAVLFGLYLLCIALGSAFYRFILQPVRR
jgi:hypothetical protein